MVVVFARVLRKYLLIEEDHLGDRSPSQYFSHRDNLFQSRNIRAVCFRFMVLWLQVRFEFLTHAQHKMSSQLGESPSSSRLVYKDRRRLCSQSNKWYPRTAFSFCPHDGQARLRPRHFPTFKAYLQSTCLFVVATVCARVATMLSILQRLSETFGSRSIFLALDNAGSKFHKHLI